MRAFAAIGLGLSIVLTACGAGGGAAPSATTAATVAAATATPLAKAVCAAKKITIAVPVTPPNVVHLTPYVADSFGYFKDENLTVELVRFDGGVGSLRASASCAIDLAGSSAEPVLDAIANGADVKIVYTYAPNVDVSFAVGPGIKTLADLKKQKGKDIWLWGGGELFRSVLELGLVDQLEVAIIPVLLGDGLPLLPRSVTRAKLKLTGEKLFKKTGTLMLNYEVRRSRKS